MSETNVANICGEVSGQLKFSHKIFGEAFYTFEVLVPRNSGYEDRIIIMASERILEFQKLEKGIIVKIFGQIRTYNETSEGRNKLNIVIFAKEIVSENQDTEYMNEIYLEGYLCKNPISRTSPLGRKICDLMVAVNRMYNKSDYIPCIAWGRNAVFAGNFRIGEKISIRGRLQSREYKKKNENGEVTIKTAYEVSIMQLETILGE